MFKNEQTMKCGNSNEVIHKDVVIIGNGPSGITLSYMLSGNVPYVTSNAHPDEFLSARLATVLNKNLIHEDLEYLSGGLEGRTTNPVSLLIDNLMHPCADIGLELEPLVEWRNDGFEISHVVLGKGPPGGSWNSMDPQILTLSLGSWMGLPGLPYKSRNGSETRASAKNVADYYKHYVEQMDLTKNFKNQTLVTSIKPYHCRDSKSKWVEKVDSDIKKKAKLCARLEAKETSTFSRLCSPRSSEKESKSCTFSNAINYLLSRNQKKTREEDLMNILGGDYKCDSCLKEQRKNKKLKLIPRVPNSSKHCDSYRWLVEAVDLKTKECFTYSCDYLVVANGSSDLPNRLSISDYKTDPFWLLYDLRSLEIELDLLIQNAGGTVDPVLVIGAGLSAADAIIATRGRNVDVMHLFRNKSSNLGKQLPENMYPEYHKVHQMMKNESKYPYYVPLPESTLTNVDHENRTVTLKSCEGSEETVKVSFVVVLIGSKPDMSFLPANYNIAVKKNQPLDCKTNTVSINKITHSVNGCEGLYALGPLAGDNFVRFLPGGALAVLSDLYKKYEL